MTCPPLKTRNGHISLSALSLLSRALHWTVAMGLPTYVKAINLVVNGMLLMSGLRDWCAALLRTRVRLNLQASAASRTFERIAIAPRSFAPGAALPIPGDAEFMKVWGSTFTVLGSRVAAPVEGANLMLEQTGGAMEIGIAVAKLTTVWTNTQEGTFLRRNLLGVFGVVQLLMAFLLYKHTAFIKDNYGADLTMWSVLTLAEGLIYLGDVLLRERKTKTKKK